LFARLAIASQEALNCNYTVNGNHGLYLADGIYPAWSTFVKSMHIPKKRDGGYFLKAQEEAQKDMERAFGVLQAHFAIV
jgi:hypothetical protein